MGYTVNEMISQKEVEERIKALGAQISKDYEGESVHLICILKMIKYSSSREVVNLQNILQFR